MTSHDEWYNIWNANTLANACIVRITNQCDQECRHCCFRSGPNNIGQMSVKTCEGINAWVPKKILLNIMGGEITVLFNYPEMLVALARDRYDIRLVTNGFWAGRNNNKFFNTMKQIKAASCPNINVAVSQDRWHKYKRPGYLAASLLRKSNHGINLSTSTNWSDITPVGRAWDNNLLSSNSQIRSCEEMSNITITEDGMVCRCPFGYFPWKHFSETTWDEAQDYVWGWRSEELANGMNCNMCMEAVEKFRYRNVGSMGRAAFSKELENVKTQ